MIIGIDKGASAVKLAAMENGEVLYLKTLVGDERPLRDLYFEFLSENVLGETQVEQIAVTGVGAEKAFFEGVKVPVLTVPEIEATGKGGTALARKSKAIVVSIGTGTSLVLARDGNYTHIGGSGVGSGTLRGLSRKMFEKQDVRELFRLSEYGNRLSVDLTVGDLFSGTDTLPPDLTASNLAKASENAAEADWAKAVVNMVLEVAGSHAALACKAYGVDTVVVTGGVSATKISKQVYDNFSRLYHLNYIVPEHSAYATAIGAAGIAMEHGA
ncbi:MAG: hypothetical protein ACOX66_05875 [Oscillospiraceae bacterium]|jgi:type II pantothenate kinase